MQQPVAASMGSEAAEEVLVVTQLDEEEVSSASACAARAPLHLIRMPSRTHQLSVSGTAAVGCIEIPHQHYGSLA